MTWRKSRFLNKRKMVGSTAILFLYCLMISCEQPAVINGNDIRYHHGKYYFLKDEEIKSIIQNNLLLSPDDIKYGGGMLFYPDGTGIIFSEGSIKMKYFIKRGNLCLNYRHSFCFKIVNRNNQYYKIDTNKHGIYAEKLEIKPFIK